MLQHNSAYVQHCNIYWNDDVFYSTLVLETKKAAYLEALLKSEQKIQRQNEELAKSHDDMKNKMNENGKL